MDLSKHKIPIEKLVLYFFVIPIDVAKDISSYIDLGLVNSKLFCDMIWLSFFTSKVLSQGIAPVNDI